MRHVGLAGLSCCLLLMNAPTWAKEQEGTVIKLRAVTKLVDRDHEVFEIYGAAKTGKETKMLEIVYTRKQ